MKKDIIKRVLEESLYMLNTKKTIREIAKVFGVSKSTVHKDLNERLLELNPILQNQIAIILQEHIEVRHIRGGQKTKEKYLLKK